MTHKAYGEGHAYYVGADMEQAFYDDLFKGVAEEAGVKSLAEAVPEVYLSMYVSRKMQSICLFRISAAKKWLFR